MFWQKFTAIVTCKFTLMILFLNYKTGESLWRWRSKEIPKGVYMVRPIRFVFNYETAEDNVFQNEPKNYSKEYVQSKALEEFEGMVKLLRKYKIDVVTGDDTKCPYTSDSIFPTNWVSTLPDGTLAFFPMKAPIRRLERKPHLINQLKRTYKYKRIINYTHFEDEGKYLEGDPSVRIDYYHSTAYSCLSPRTNAELAMKFANEVGIRNIVIFEGKDANGVAIYHTDVMMSIADEYVLICLDCIPNIDQRNQVMEAIRKSGKRIIPVAMNQLTSFIPNMIQLQSLRGKKYGVMSTRAYNNLTYEQKTIIKSYNKIIHSDLTTIEDVGGGSAHCLMVKIYLKKKFKKILPFSNC